MVCIEGEPMKPGLLVMLVKTEPGLPPIGSCGEIVEAFDGEDFGVDFPHHKCEAGPEPYFYAPPSFLIPIGWKLTHEQINIIIDEEYPK